MPPLADKPQARASPNAQQVITGFIGGGGVHGAPALWSAGSGALFISGIGDHQRKVSFRSSGYFSTSADAVSSVSFPFPAGQPSSARMGLGQKSGPVCLGRGHPVARQRHRHLGAPPQITPPSLSCRSWRLAG